MAIPVPDRESGAVASQWHTGKEFLQELARLRERFHGLFEAACDDTTPPEIRRSAVISMAKELNLIVTQAEPFSVEDHGALAQALLDAQTKYQQILQECRGASFRKSRFGPSAVRDPRIYARLVHQRISEMADLYLEAHRKITAVMARNQVLAPIVAYDWRIAKQLSEPPVESNGGTPDPAPAPAEGP